MESWAPLVAGRSVDSSENGIKIVRDMADEALLHLLKMRRSKTRRGGLPRIPKLVRPYLVGGEHLEVCFPKSLTYFRQKLGPLLVDESREPMRSQASRGVAE